MFGGLLRGAADAALRDGIEPMDRALFDCVPGHPDAGEVLQWEGVAPGRPFVCQVWRQDHHRLVALKGAPEAVLARCGGDPSHLSRLQAQADDWASRGLRVIAVARSVAPSSGDVPDVGHQALGLVAFEDPLRSDVAEAIRACQEAGVRVVMITGDAPATAWAIASAAGIVGPGPMDERCLSGRALDALDEPMFRQTVKQVRVFARVSPTQKLRIVQALQSQGEVVAMTGDGVNDGPALRAADIGVAMGQRGTDVAREAAALVLLDDRFGSLVEAVRGGRRIFDNLQKALGYLFAVHVPIVGVSMLPVLGGPVLLTPLHIVLLELIIDPACSLVFEAEPAATDTMRRPPRRPDAPLFSRRDVVRALAIGGASLAVTALGQIMGTAAGWDDAMLRSTAFVTVVVGNLVMLRGFRGGPLGRPAPNPAYDVLVLAVCAASVPMWTVEAVSGALGFPPGLPAAWTWGLLALPAAAAAWRLARRATGRISRSGIRTDRPMP